MDTQDDGSKNNDDKSQKGFEIAIEEPEEEVEAPEKLYIEKDKNEINN